MILALASEIITGVHGLGLCRSAFNFTTKVLRRRLAAFFFASFFYTNECSKIYVCILLSLQTGAFDSTHSY